MDVGGINPSPARPAPRPVSPPVLLYGHAGRHPNIFYRTHFVTRDPYVVVDEGPGRVTAWVNPVDFHRAAQDARPGVTVRSFAELHPSPALIAAAPALDSEAYLLASVLEAHKLRKVLVDKDFPAAELQDLALLGFSLTIGRHLYQRERRIKTAQELEQLTATHQAAMDVMNYAISIIKAAEIKNGRLYRNGDPLTGDGVLRLVEQRLLEIGYTTEGSIVAGGPYNADPHRTTSPVLRAGFPIVIDIYPFGKIARMWGDLTRTVVRGDAPADVDRMYAAVQAAEERAVSMVRPGVTGAQIHTAVLEEFKRRGFASDAPGYRDIPSRARFTHGTGHGMGLEEHEDPVIGTGAADPLEAGDVITIEPGLYDPVLGGVRLEDTLVVTQDGHYSLTPYAKVFHI